MLFFSQNTPLICSAANGQLEVTRLLVESESDVAARDRCFNPPPSHHLSLTICLAALAKLHSNTPSTRTKPTWLHTCEASALLNDAPPRAAAAQIKTALVRVAAAVRGEWLLQGNITEFWCYYTSQSCCQGVTVQTLNLPPAASITPLSPSPPSSPLSSSSSFTFSAATTSCWLASALVTPPALPPPPLHPPLQS